MFLARKNTETNVTPQTTTDSTFTTVRFRYPGTPPSPEYKTVNACHASHVNFETKKTPIREFRKSTGSGHQPAHKRPRTRFIRNSADKALRNPSLRQENLGKEEENGLKPCIGALWVTNSTR